MSELRSSVAIPPPEDGEEGAAEAAEAVEAVVVAEQVALEEQPPPQDGTHKPQASCFSRCVSMCVPGSLAEPGSVAEAEWRDATDFYGMSLPQEAFERSPEAEQVRLQLNVTGFQTNETVERLVSPGASMAVFKYRLHRYPPAGLLIPPGALLTVTFAGIELEDDETFLDHGIEDDAVLSVLWDVELAPFEVHLFAKHYRPPHKKAKATDIMTLNRVRSSKALDSSMGRTGSRDNDGGITVAVWSSETLGGVINRVAGRTDLPVFLTPEGQRQHAGMEPIGFGLKELGTLESRNVVPGQYIIVEEETVVEIPLSEGPCCYDCAALDPCFCQEGSCDECKLDEEPEFLLVWLIWAAFAAFVLVALVSPVYTSSSTSLLGGCSSGTTNLALTYIETTCANGTSTGKTSWFSGDVCVGYRSSWTSCSDAKKLFEAAGLMALVSFCFMMQGVALITMAMLCENRSSEWLSNHSIRINGIDDCVGAGAWGELCCCCCDLGCNSLRFCCQFVDENCCEDCFGDECTVEEDYFGGCCNALAEECCCCEGPYYCCDDDCFFCSSFVGFLLSMLIGICVTAMMTEGAKALDSDLTLSTGGILFVLSWAIPVALSCCLMAAAD